MRKWNMKRVFVVAAAVCVLGTITAVAAGKVVYTSGGGSHLDDFTYDKLGEMETKLGYTTNAPEVFSNGYRYDEEGQPDQTFDHNGITLNYTRDQYRFVPPDYQVSDEEKAKEAAGELYISYGSDTVTDQVAQSMLWKDGEKVYIITAMDNPMTAQDMARMAGELIDNKQ